MKSVHIYLCRFYLCTLTFIFCIENLLFTLFLFHRRKRIVCFLLPLRKKITTKWCTFTKCYGGSSILYGDSSKPNWNPTSIVNWFVTQFMIGEKCGIEFGVGLSDATRPWIKGVVPCQPASANLANKILNLYKIFCIQQCKYICSNSDLRFAALDLKELLHQSFATGYFYHSRTIHAKFQQGKVRRNSGIHLWFSVFYFRCLFFLPLFGVCPSFLWSLKIQKWYAWDSSIILFQQEWQQELLFLPFIHTVIMGVLMLVRKLSTQQTDNII